jgi:hypothetical protein
VQARDPATGVKLESPGVFCHACYEIAVIELIHPDSGLQIQPPPDYLVRNQKLQVLSFSFIVIGGYIYLTFQCNKKIYIHAWTIYLGAYFTLIRT